MININKKNYEIIKILHDNRTSKLFKCKHMNNFFVVKCYKRKYINRWKKEIEISNSIGNHPNIIKIVNYSSQIVINETIYYPLVMKFYKDGDLFDFICNNIGLLDKKFVIDIFKEILIGVNHLNKHGWAHRDLKPENILITNINPVKVKIIDFEYTTKSKYSASKVGTVSYMSHQLIIKETYNTKKNDIWTLGVLLFIIYTGRRPYNSVYVDKNLDLACEWLIAIKEKNWKVFWNSIELSCQGKLNVTLLDENNDFDSNFKDLIQRMLSWNENKRINIDRIFNHLFLNYDKVLSNNDKNHIQPKCANCIIF